MKILLIYLEKEKDNTGRLVSFLKKKEISVSTLPIKSQEETRGNIEKQFTAFFAPLAPEGKAPQTETPSHVVVLSALASGWVDFFAGFSCGSHVPFLVCGKEAIKSIREVFSFCFKLFESETDLHKYFDNEYEVYRKIEADREIKAAREGLLRMGIPVNEESMARSVTECRVLEILFFLAAGFSPNTRNKAGVPLLSIAARIGNREIARFLFMAGAELDIKANDRNTTPFLDSVMAKHHELTMDFLKAGADVNIQSRDGQTALVIAVGAGDDKMVEALLKAGADPDIPDSMGVSARKYASLFHNKTMIGLFEAHAPQKTA